MTEVKNIIDILKNLKGRRQNKNKSCYNNGLARRVLKAYFKEIKEITLRGFEFKLPKDFGVAFIKQSDRGEKLKKTKRAKSRLKDYNTKRLGKAYRFVIEGGFMKRSGYKIESTNRDTRRLCKKLCNTNIEYRTSLISI